MKTYLIWYRWVLGSILAHMYSFIGAWLEQISLESFHISCDMQFPQMHQNWPNLSLLARRCTFSSFQNVTTSAKLFKKCDYGEILPFLRKYMNVTSVFKSSFSVYPTHGRLDLYVCLYNFVREVKGDVLHII